MSRIEQIKVPNIGDFQDVDVIEVLVSPGDAINIDDPLITLESDKASMDVPAPMSGTVKALTVSVGDKVSEGTVILTLEIADAAQVADRKPQPKVHEAASTAAAPADAGGGYGGGGIKDVRVPDIGDFTDVDIIEVLVSAGDHVSVDDPLITLESDKASMEVPCPHAGVVRDVKVRVGEQVSQGDVILTMELSSGTAAAAPTATEAHTIATSTAAHYGGSADVQAQVVVLGSGPGGYTAAFRAADLGRKTVLIERYATLGGVCLNVGCIPSKALLHAAKVLDEAQDFAVQGIKFGAPEVDIDTLRGWKDGIVARLTGGLAGLAKQRKVEIIQGAGRFLDSHNLEVAGPDGSTSVVEFQQCIIAAGSEAVNLPFIPDDPRVLDSTGALKLADVPKRLLVIGGGIIGLEMATVYHALGTKITVVEMLDALIAGADKDIVRPLQKRIAKRYEAILLNTRVTAVEAVAEGMKVSFEGDNAPGPQVYDRLLVAVGRTPNGHTLDAHKAGVVIDDRGFIRVDKQQRTNVSHIFAIGDIVGQPMLAHKAVHEGKVAAEVCAGMNAHFDARAIPSVAYTDPEVAWVGITEAEAKTQGIDHAKGVFPWAANGRSLALGRDEGVTKLIFDPDSERLLGAGIVGPNAGDLIAEAALAIEMGCDAADIGLTVHPHPTLSETVAMSAEAFEGTITDLYMPKKKQ